MHELIVNTSKKGDETIAIDKKEYLFEAQLNKALGKSVIDSCRHLVKLCPQYVPTYLMMREESMANGCQIVVEEEEDENTLVTAFNDNNISSSDFEKMLEEADKSSFEFKLFSRKVRNIEKKC